jgi:hypothetical protein
LRSIWQNLETVNKPPKGGNTTEEKDPNRTLGIQASKILTTLPTRFQLLVLVFILRNLGEELNKAKNLIKQSSISEMIAKIWKADKKEKKVSAQKIDAILALDILSRFKGDNWKEFLEELHRGGVNPHVLAVRWFDKYTTFWWGYLKERWNIRKKEVENRMSPESAAAVGGVRD